MRRASRRRTSSLPSSCARSRVLQTWRASSRCPTVRRSGPDCSISARTSSARKPTCARLPPDATLTVVGSINLDLVTRVERLPRPGETLSGATLERVPGGKGAQQAVAAARLGANVIMVGCVGADPTAEEALVGLRAAGVQLEVRESDAPTGVAI